jgi:hypothetical protein
MPLKTSTDATPFAQVLEAIKTRIGTIPNSGLIRICAAPDEQLTPYLAESGFLIRPDAPAPIKGTGAGRYGLLAWRNVEVVIVGQSYSDYAGDDSTAVANQSNMEEAVIDCLSLVPWGGQAFQTPVIAIEVHWVPGGKPMNRDYKSDVGLIVSSLIFQVKYTVPCTVYLG